MAGIFSYQYFHFVQIHYLSITSFDTCVKAGYVVTITYPEKCVLPGKSFTNPLQQEQQNISLKEKNSTRDDYKNLSYVVEGQQFQLHNGEGIIFYTVDTIQSSSTIRIIGTPFYYDINNDNKEDIIFLMEVIPKNNQVPLHLISAALQLNNGYTGTNVLYVDMATHNDSFMYKNGEIVLRYTIGTATTTPQEKYFIFKDAMLIENKHK